MVAPDFDLDLGFTMKKIRLIMLPVMLLMLCMLTGCSEKNTKTEEGMQLLETLQYSAALEVFDEAQEAGENMRLISRGRGIAYLGEAKYEEAKECFLLSLSLSNGFLQDIDYDINFYLAESYVGLGEYEEAEAVYSSILALDEQPRAYYLRGNVRLLQGSFTAGQDDFAKAIALSPKDVDLVIRIYSVLEANGYAQDGQEYLQNALDSYEKNMTPLNKGKIYYFMGQYQTAAVSLEEARSKDNNDAEASLYLGKAYEAVGEYNYATNVYENYLARNPDNAVLYNQLAICKMKLGDYEGALVCVQAGMQIGDATMMQSLAYNEIVAYEYLGQFQKAQALIYGYLENYPTDEEALRESIFLATR